MTRRSRLESKLERREEWADKATARSTNRFNAVSRIADQIPFGQPILVGHHSEAHARRDQERIFNGMSKAVEESNLAKHHAQAASGIAHQLKVSIFSDDDNATEALADRITRREAKAERMVEINKAYRKALKATGDTVKALGQLVNDETITMAEAKLCASNIAADWRSTPMPFADYQMTNLRGNIRRDKERIKEIERQQEQTARAEASGGVTVEGDDWVRVTFAEKPDYSIIASLKAADFGWRGGSWIGRRDKLPAGIVN